MPAGGRDTKGAFVDLNVLPSSGRDTNGVFVDTAASTAAGEGIAGHYVDLAWEPAAEPPPPDPATLPASKPIARPPIDLRRYLAGHYGRIQMEVGMYVSNIRGEELALIDRVSGMSIDLDNTREAAWGLTATMPYTELFDPRSDYVKAVVDVKLPDRWERYAMGLYGLEIPEDALLEHSKTWALSGFSAEQVLAEQMANNGYSVGPGSAALNRVRLILQNQFGVPDDMINFPVEDVVLTTGILFDIVQNTAGCYWLSICNSILAAGGFTPLHTDKNGVWFTEKQGQIKVKVPSVRYGEGPDKENLFDSTEPIPVRRDMGEFANVITVISNDIEQIPPVCAIVVNDDPNHPYSTVNYRRREDTVELQQIVGPVEARAIGQEELDRRGGVPETIRVQTKCDPERGPGEVCTAEYYHNDGSNAIVGRYMWTGFGFDVNEGGAPSKMTHELSILEDFVE